MLKKLFLTTIVLSLFSVHLNGACSDKTIFSSDYKIEIFFSIIEVLQNFGLIMNNLVYKKF